MLKSISCFILSGDHSICTKSDFNHMPTVAEGVSGEGVGGADWKVKDNGNGPLPVGIKSAVLASRRSFRQSACPQGLRCLIQ